MFGTISKTNLCSMYGNKFEMEYMDRLFRKWYITFSLIEKIILFSYIL